MATTTRTQRRYDHRLQELVRTTRDIDCALQRGVPRSTTRGWLKDPGTQVVSVDVLSMDATQLQREVLQLRRRAQKLVAFYVQEHNTRLPHSAFRGQTPDEMYFGTGASVPAELEAARQKARQARAEANRKRTCSACELVAVSLN